VIVIQIGLSNLRGIVGGKDLDLDHKAIVPAGTEFFSAEVAGDMQHECVTLQAFVRQQA
jgi:hypothetical protein